MECSICGISGKMRSVSEVISPKGLILACEKCAIEERYPILKKTDKNVLEQAERKKSSVYERLSRLAGIKPLEPEKFELKKQEESLRKIIDRNYEEKMRKQDLILKSRPDLIDKFHWIIMRVRRARGITQKQLAEAIIETEAAIKMAEQGIVPEGYGLIDKIQRFLNVRLIKERTLYRDFPLDKNQAQEKAPEILPMLRPQQQRTPIFDRKSTDSLTIADLQRMKKEREMEMFLGEEEKEDEKEPAEDREKETF